MSFLSRIIGPSLSAPAREQLGAGGWSGVGNRSASGYNITPDSSLTVTAVLACVRVVAEGVAQLPWHIYERRSDGTKRLAQDYLLAPVLDAPNSWQTDFQFKELMMVCLLLRGNFYAVKVAGVNGAASELWPLHPDRVRIEKLEGSRRRFMVRDASGKEEPYTDDEIFYVQGMSLDGEKGISFITYCKEAVGTSKAAETHGASFFANSARPLTVLETPNKLNKPAADELLAGWKQMHGGPRNAGSTAILTNGLKAHELGVSNVDAQFLETRRFQIEEIARVFRVPVHLIGDLTRSTNNNIEHQSLEFVMWTLLPWLVRIEKAAKRDLITDPRYYLKFNLEGMLRGDQAARVNFYQSAINCGLMTINECRELEDLNPTEGGDVHLVQGAMTTLDRIINPPEPAPAAPPPSPVVEDESDDEADELRGHIQDLRAMNSLLKEVAEDERKRREIAESNAAQATAYAAAERQRADDAAKVCKDAALRTKDAEQAVLNLKEVVRGLEAERLELKARHAADLKAFQDATKMLSDSQGIVMLCERRAMSLTQSRFADMVELESEAARRALNKGNFLAAIDAMREKTADRMTRALAATVEVLSAAKGAAADLGAAIGKHVARSHAELLAAADVTPDQLPARVEEVLASWPARANEFVNDLFAEKDNADDRS